MSQRLKEWALENTPEPDDSRQDDPRLVDTNNKATEVLDEHKSEVDPA